MAVGCRLSARLDEGFDHDATFSMPTLSLLLGPPSSRVGLPFGPDRTSRLENFRPWLGPPDSPLEVIAPSYHPTLRLTPDTNRRCPIRAATKSQGCRSLDPWETDGFLLVPYRTAVNALETQSCNVLLLRTVYSTTYSSTGCTVRVRVLYSRRVKFKCSRFAPQNLEEYRLGPGRSVKSVRTTIGRVTGREDVKGRSEVVGV